MPTRKDKTNVAPIYREQVFIPASGTTLMKQKARPKVAGRPVSSGAVEIVSPEFDLLTGIRGITNLPKGFLKTNKLPQGENLYYRQLDKSSKGLERAKQVGVIDTKSSGGANFTTSRGTTLRIGKTFDTPFFAKGSLWYNNVDDMDVIVGKDNPLLDWKMITQHGRVTENAMKAANRRTPFYNGATNQAPTELFELYRRYPGIGYRNVTHGFPTIPITGLNTAAEQMKCGGRRKAQLGLDIREGGIAIPIAPNMYYMDGRSHDDGGIAIGPNNKNGLEVEGGEVVKVGKNDVKVFSSVPLLRGVSPAQLVMGGANPDAVFKAQEEFKDRNRINDDGTTYEMGGEGKAKSKRSRPVTGVLPYGYTIRNLYSVENPYRKGIKGNIAKMYDSRTLGAGVDVVSGHPELYKKAKSGKMTKKQADETAVIHLRKDDNAIRSNYADVYGKAASDTLSYGPRFLVAQARYQQGNVRKAWQPIHKAMAKGDAKALKKAVLQVTPKDHAYRRKWIEGFKVYKMGGMIYEINGNVRNGLSLRHKALLGTERKVEGYGNTIIVGDDTFMLNEEGVYVPVGNVQINKQPKTVRGASGRRDIAYDRQGNRYQRRSDGSLIRVSPEKGNIAVSDTIRGVEVTAPDVTKTHSRKQINAATKTSYTKANPRRQKVEPNFEIGDQTVVNFLRNNNSKYNTQRSPIHSFTPAQKLGLSSYGWSTYNDPNKGYSFREDAAAVRAGQKSVDEIIGQDLSQVNFNSNQSESTPRGRGTKVITSKDTSQSSPTLRNTIDKITMDAWTASKTPKIDLSKAKMPIYNVSDLGSKESRAAKAKLNTSSTGGGTQSKEAPWIPQYNTITGRDWLGVGTNLAGHIASYFANNTLLKKAPMPIKPVQFQAAKLKTTHNINSDLANINEVSQMNLAEVGRNTSSSSTSIARKQRIMNEARDARNKLYGQKENIETQLINLDRRNRQDVYNRNIAAYNDWLDKTYVAKSNQLLNKQRNLTNLISGIPMAVNTMLGTIENRKSTNDMIRAIAAANPNVDGRLLGIGDYYTQKQSNGRTAVYNKNHKLVKYV